MLVTGALVTIACIWLGGKARTSAHSSNIHAINSTVLLKSDLSISRRRRTMSRNLLGTKLGEVRMAVTPWSAGRTRYTFNNRICGSATSGACSNASSSSASPAGCLSMCRIFQNDCSGFARWIVKSGLGPYGPRVSKTMASHMRRRSEQRRRTDRSYPFAGEFYELFNEEFTPGVTSKSQKPKYPWQGIEKLSDATAGDLLVWRYRESSRTTGHVVIVASEPQHLGGSAYRIVVADSAKSGHSAEDDTRKLGGCDHSFCGVGFGSMFFDVDEKPTNQRIPLVFARW